MGGARTTALGFAEWPEAGRRWALKNPPHYPIITRCSQTLIPAQRARPLAAFRGSKRVIHFQGNYRGRRSLGSCASTAPQMGSNPPFDRARTMERVWSS
jgi:hypothetical protein